MPDLASLLAEGPIDAALIDINLGHSHTFDFARELQARAIPFAFLTGYDAGMLPDDLAASVCISKSRPTLPGHQRYCGACDTRVSTMCGERSDPTAPTNSLIAEDRYAAIAFSGSRLRGV